MPNDLQLRRLFESCVDQHADSMYRVAYRLMGNHDLANELIQETFLQAWAGIESLKQHEKMRGWIFAILRNQHTKMLRKIGKSHQLSDSMISTLTHRETTDDKQNSNRVQQAVRQLDDKHKYPLLMVAMEGMSVEEAAGVLQLPRGTVLSRLHRARQKLKSILLREERSTS